MLIAVDTNVLLDLAHGIDDVADGFDHANSLFRQRLTKNWRTMQIKPVIPQAHIMRCAPFGQLARNIRPTELLESEHVSARSIGRRLRTLGLLPNDEVNDALIVAETALLKSAILLTSDAHLRGLDFTRLTFELRHWEFPAPIIATPREVVHKFF